MPSDKETRLIIEGIPQATLAPLAGLRRDQFFKASAQIAGELIVREASFFVHVDTFGSDRLQVAKDAVLRHEYNSVTPGTAEYTSLLKLSHTKQEFWRAIALDALSRDDLGFDPMEHVVVRGGLRIASVFDNISLRWRQTMVNSQLGQRLQEMGAENAAQWLKERDAVNPYAVVYQRGDEVTQVPYADAFKREYRQLNSILTKLRGELGDLSQSDRVIAMVKYFEAYQKASMQTDLGQLEGDWREVDLTWMDVHGPLQPIHGMESYAEPARLRVDPEFRIVIADEESHDLNDRAYTTQQRLIRDYDEVYGGYPTLRSSLQAMQNSTVLAGTTIVISGACLDFRPAGQNVPNRGDVRVEKGVKIFMDAESMNIRTAQMRRLMGAIIGKEATDKEFVDPDHMISAGLLITGHEVSHNAFVTPDTEKRIGVTLQSLKSLIEETKAEFGILALLPKQHERGEISSVEMRKVATHMVAESLRFLLYRDIPTIRPYYNIALASLGMLMDAGFLKKDGGRWSINQDEASVTNFFGLVTKAFSELAHVYDGYDPKGAQDFSSKYFVETPQIMELQALAKSAENPN